MKPPLILLLFCLFPFTIGDSSPKKFEVTFIVTYNEMTLAQANEFEQKFRELYKDACKVDVKIAEIVNLGGSGIVVDTLNGNLQWPRIEIDTTVLRRRTDGSL